MGAQVIVHQPGWSWCSKCQGLFFSALTKGRCPAGGFHSSAGSGAYQLPLTGFGQPNWRWCRRCEGLFFYGNKTSQGFASCGRCPVPGPAGGVHDPAFSASYFLDMGVLSPDVTNQQSGWRWCRKCEGLFFGGGPLTGRCPAGGGGHDGKNSGNYNLTL